MPQKALQSFEDTLYQGILPDVLTYSAVVSACEQVPPSAVRVFEGMLHQAS